MAERTLSGRKVFDVAKLIQTPQKDQLPKRIRIRPIDGGLNASKTSDQIEPTQQPAMQDVSYHKNEVRKAIGTTQVGADFADVVMYSGVWERLDGTFQAFAITQKELYRYNPATAAYVVVSPSVGGVELSGSTSQRIQVSIFDDVLYFGSDANVLRSWDGGAATTHAPVSGGFTCRGIEAVANHLVLVATKTGAILDGQTVKWSQSGSVVFTGTGSGSNDLADRDDICANIAKLGPYRALIYKTKSIVEMRSTGDASAPFEFTELVGGLGILLPYTLAPWAGGHFFVGNDEQVYTYNGANLEAIGDNIRDELFDDLDHSLPNIAIGSYDSVENEYILAIPISGTDGNKRYYAYNIAKKRWRQGEYSGLMHLAQYPTRLTGTTLARERQVMAASTFSKRVHLLNNEATFSFDATALSFSIQTPDIIGQNDEDEVTLKEFIIAHFVDGDMDLTVDASTDSGVTFANSVSVSFSASATSHVAGSIHYIHVPFVVTGQSIRIRIRNNTPAQKIRFIGFTPVASFTETARHHT